MPKVSHRAMLLAGSLLAFATAAMGQRAQDFDDADATRTALTQALADQRSAEARSERLEAEAAEAQDSAQRTAREAAALAARIQQAEAGIAAARARMAMVERERVDLREELGREQRPLVRLTAALQQLSRRPVGVSLLRPGDVQDIVYVRAMLHNAVPQVTASTEGLRGNIVRAQELGRQAAATAEALEAEEGALGERRQELAAIETRERLAARAATGAASREAERALALAEEARDLDGLVGELDRAAELRRRLAALPGPRLRPAAPEASEILADTAPAPRATGAPSPYMLPVTGRTLTGFGAPVSGGTSRAIALQPRAEAQVVAPSAGRIAFAGPYEGYGTIVIVEHPGGWTSLVTGLAQASVRVGEDVVAGAPLGRAPRAAPRIELELRRDGEPVNPASYLR